MSLKAELETWASALEAYDAGDYEKSLDLFSRIADSSKILTNMGLIYATIGEHELAVEQFIGATGLDNYLAVAYFQCGVSNFLLGRYELSLKDFEETILYLRGNNDINYEQLGLKFRLYAAEVLFNKGLSRIYLGDVQGGLNDMEDARREKATEEHNVIDDAIQDRGQGYTVFSIPVGILYRPAASKLKNVKTKDYLGKAKLIAAADSKDAFTTFTGVTRLQQGLNPAGESFVENGSSGALSRSATMSAPKPQLKGDIDSRAPAGTGLARAMTTINVPADRMQRIAGGAPGGPPAGGSRGGSPTAATGPSLARSNTTLNVSDRPGLGAAAGGMAVAGLSPTRGLSVRKGPPPAPQRSEEDRRLSRQIDRLALDDDRSGGPTPPPADRQGGAGNRGGDEGPRGKGPRVTEFYDSYLDSYAEEEAPELPPMPQGGDRVAAWARGAGAGGEPRRMQSSRAPSSYAPSSFGSGSMRRKPTRRGTVRGPGSRAQSSYGGGYDDEDEGYPDDEFDDMIFELVKIRVKVHYQDDVRGMALTPELPHDEFVRKVAQKFGRSPQQISLKFRDEDGGKVSLRDDSDYELAIETARESAKGRPEGKLEIWVTDI